MRDQLIQYVKLLFAATPDSEEMQQEILQNTLDRYDDLISEGKSPEAAYRLAIAGIGDLSEILGSTQDAPKNPSAHPNAEKKNAPASSKKRIMQSIAIALYICCVIPVIALGNIGDGVLGVCLMFVVIAIATVLMILAGQGDHKTQKDPEQEKTPIKSIWGTIVLIVYLSVSFATHAWYITWIIFPISALLQSLVRAFKKDNKGKAVLHSLLIIPLLVLLIFALVVGSGLRGEILRLHNSTTITGEISLPTDNIRNLSIEWAAGDIVITTADVDCITIREESGQEIRFPMAYSIEDETLTLSYSNQILLKSPDKNLYVTVPEDWYCRELCLDAAAVDITITGLQVGTLELDGAATSLQFTGSAELVDIDGAATDITLNCTNHISSIDIDGASAKLQLTLPYNCGYRLDTDGIAIDFQSERTYQNVNGVYVCGNEHCKITVDGVSCQILIQESDQCNHQWNDGETIDVPGGGQEMVYECLLCGETKTTPLECEHQWGPGTPFVDTETGESGMAYTCLICGKTTLATLTAATYQATYVNNFTFDLLLEPLEEFYTCGQIVTLKTEILYDADLHLYVNGVFICSQTEAFSSDGSNYWEFHFTMPAGDVVIEFKAVEGFLP